MVLIECLAALFIHLIIGTIVLKVTIENIRSIEERKEIARFYRVVNSICREIDRNYTNCYVDTKLSTNEKIINYDRDLEEVLTNNNLFTLVDGDKKNNYVAISIDGTDKYSMKIRVEGRLKYRNIDEKIDTRIIKNIWENK